MEEKKTAHDGPNSKLEWMYKGPNNEVDKEDYLLGKVVTNTAILPGVRNDVERDCLPTSLFSTGGSGASSLTAEQVDVARKLHEDPLLAIKKKEIERREQLLKNPVKLKKLHDMLKRQKDQLKEKQMKKKKHKSNASSDDDIDEELKKKFKKLKSKLKLVDILNLSNDDEDSDERHYSKPKRSSKKKHDISEFSDSSDASDNFTIRNSKIMKSREKLKYSKEKTKSSSEKNSNRKSFKKEISSATDSTDSGEDRKNRKRKLITGDKDNKHKNSDTKQFSKFDSYDRSIVKQKSKPDQDLSSELSSSSEFDNSSGKKKYGLVLPVGKSSRTYRKEKEEIKADDKKLNDSVHSKKIIPIDNKRYTKPRPIKLTEAEKEEKRREMMRNAEWRNELRDKNIKKYKAREEKEKNQEKDYSSDFYRKQLSYAASQGSVEGRIKSNMNRIQRSAADMDKNFARR